MFDIEELQKRAQVAVAARLLSLPKPAMEALAKRRPVEIDGYRLDPQTQFGLAILEAAGASEIHTLGVEAARANHDRMRDVFRDRRHRVGRVEETSARGAEGPLPVRLYVPRGGSSKPLPMLVYFHGGGFVLGGLDSSDSACRLLCRGVRCIVASVDYRLAPEAPFPAPVEDALAAYLDLAARAERLGADPARIAVGGDSAGGNLSAVACLLARDRDLSPPALQLLIYPMTYEGGTTRSRELLGRGFMLTTEMIAWFSETYLAGHDPSDPLVSPLRATDLRGLPPALVVTAGFDPLRDEGQDYARALVAAGVQVEELRFDHLPHGFVQMTGSIAAARTAVDDIASALHRAFAG